jgi:hypothetical protein
MAIEIIPNQPVLFRPVGWREPCPCDNCEDCMLVQQDDFIFAQVPMPRCGDDFICGQPVTSAELVVNGEFDGETGWEEAGNNWAIAGDKACYTAADGAGVLYQTIPGLTEGFTYKLVFTISDFVAGTLTPNLWDTPGTVVSANGTYEQFITIAPGHIGETLNFVDIAWNGCITNISLVQMPSCWDTSFSGDNPFIFNTDSACVSGTGDLFTDTLANGPGYFVVSFTISNYVSGAVIVSGACVDPWSGAPFSGNGEKFAYGSFAGPGVLCLSFLDFFGCVSDIHLYRLNAPQFVIENQETQQQYLDLNDGAYLNFLQDRVTVKFQPLEFLPYGCYKICIIDTCLIAGETNKVTNGTFDETLDDWSPGSGWAWDAANGGEALFDRSTGTGSLSQEFSVTDITVCARITVYDISGAGAFVRFHLRNAANNSVTFLDITTPGVYSICGLGNQIAVEPSNIAGTIVEVDNIGVFQVENCEDCSPYDYCSNCIKFAESFDTCVLLVESYNNENGSWGFVWNNVAGTNIFKLSHRLPAKLWHPVYPEESNDYTFSDGKTSDTFALSDKVWTLGIDPESERTHDVVRLQKRSDHFIITDINESREFFAEKGDYNPEWADGGCKAPANIKVKLKTSTLFNNLCSE